MFGKCTNSLLQNFKVPLFKLEQQFTKKKVPLRFKKKCDMKMQHKFIEFISQQGFISKYETLLKAKKKRNDKSPDFVKLMPMIF